MIFTHVALPFNPHRQYSYAIRTTHFAMKYGCNFVIHKYNSSRGDVCSLYRVAQSCILVDCSTFSFFYQNCLFLLVVRFFCRQFWFQLKSTICSISCCNLWTGPVDSQHAYAGLADNIHTGGDSALGAAAEVWQINILTGKRKHARRILSHHIHCTQCSWSNDKLVQ